MSQEEVSRKMLEQIEEMFEDLDNHCEPARAGIAGLEEVTFKWTSKGVGFGEFSIYRGTNSELRCANECMSKDFIKSMLCKMVDDCELDDPE